MDDDFQTADAGASNTTPLQCSALRKGGHVVIKNRPCKIVEMSTSKTGKHGHAKVHLVGIDIFTNKKYEDICPSTHNMNVPKVNRKEYSVMDIQDDFLDLYDETAQSAREDLKVPDGEVGADLKKQFEDGKNLMVTVLSAMGEECVVSHKVSTT